MKTTLYTGKVTVRSGRDGSARSDDGKLDAQLAFPKALGGTGDGTNPEQLFAAAYGACFSSTLALVAKAQGTTLTDVAVRAEVDMLNEDGNYDLAVRLVVKASGTDRRTLEQIIERTRHACPYSRATRNTLATSVEVEE